MLMKVMLTCAIATLLATTNLHAKYASESTVQPFPETDNVPAEHDSSVLVRRHSAVTIRVRTSGLDPLSPYTLWAVIFNKPQYCATTPCTAADLPVVTGHDPRVEASIVYAGGGLSNASGLGDLIGRVYPTRSGVTVERLFGFGLLDARRAEIHVVVRGHGQPTSDDLFAALGSYAGGCNGENRQQPPCEDQQFAIHLGE